MQIQVSLKVMPTMANHTLVYDKVNEVIKQIINSNLKALVGPSETTIEGDYDEVFALIKTIHQQLVKDEVTQITMIIITDYNQQQTYIKEKLANVNNYLQE